MDSKFKFKRLNLAVASALLVVLAGCGGGSSGDSASSGAPADNKQAASISFSGSAAVGAPLVGTVTVKDALGAIKATPISANGSYTIDVTGMTAPFVFRAEGTANGQTYVVHSIATAADAAGKINITQLTDLVVANIAGQIAKNYFDKFEQSGNADAATKDAINAEVDKLKEKLLPVLTALGVDAGIDLLRTPFTPLSSALDKALDAIQVSVDESSNVATISTLLNTIAITDSLAVKAAAETSPPTLDATGVTADSVATAASDAVLVKKAVTDFIAQFANGLPTAAQLTPLFTTGFLHHDINRTNFVNAMSGFSTLVGGSVDHIDIQNIDYSDPTKITARVSFTLKGASGAVLNREVNWRVRKGTDGIWRLHGDQRVLDITAYANISKNITPTMTCFNTGLEFDIENLNSANDGGTIAYVIVTGPGLPPGGLRYDAGGGQWNIHGQTSPYYNMAYSCNGNDTNNVPDAGIAAIPDDAFYTFTAYDSLGVKINFPSGTADGTYGLKVPRRPLTLAETKAATTFPTITSPASVSALDSYVSGPLTIAAGNVNPANYTWIYLAQSTTTNDFRTAETDVAPTASGTASTSLTLTAAASGTINWKTIRVSSRDAGRRDMMTVYAIGTQP